MTVELKELVIRTSIVSNQASSDKGQSDLNQEAVIAACVSQVLQELKREGQR